eukprot:scaffold294_cov221-Amphora_coffeaeformis.AAC.14
MYFRSSLDPQTILVRTLLRAAVVLHPERDARIVLLRRDASASDRWIANATRLHTSGLLHPSVNAEKTPTANAIRIPGAAVMVVKTQEWTSPPRRLPAPPSLLAVDKDTWDAIPAK